MENKWNLISAYKNMFMNYAEYNGRASRSEFWLAYLMNMLVVCAAYVIVGAMQAEKILWLSALMSGLISLYSLATIVPFMCLSIRRLHDVGKSGWFYLICLIPVIGAIVLIVFFSLDSNVGDNLYGSNPKGIN